jgi:anthranilate phosphoribosyltransferase
LPANRRAFSWPAKAEEIIMYQDAIIAAAAAAEEVSSDPFDRLMAGYDLSSAEAECLFARLVAGDLNETAIAALLVSLRIKGETTNELTGAARALQAAAMPFETPDYLFADSCGTGADGSGTINVSTAVAFVAAACGLPIAKHGNRSVTSRCGSADVLEAMGAKIDLSPIKSRQMLDEIGLCFLFAPCYHPGLRHAGPVRRQLKVRTIMNFLGPCLNPAHPPVQLLGVADPAKLEPVARTLAALGVRDALVVHGGGLDEIATHAETMAVRLAGGAIEHLLIRPEDAGLDRAPLDDVKGGEPDVNADRLRALLAGRAGAAERDLVVLNAAALLHTAGKAATLKQGAAMAVDAIASRDAATLAKRFIEASND